MQYSEGAVGRIFAIRLEHGDPMPASLEQLAAAKGVRAGLAIMVGGADDGSRFVVGPEDGETLPPVPMVSALRGVHEAAAVGTLFPDETGKPVLHMHSTFGRGDAALSGCIREGIVTWHIPVGYLGTFLALAWAIGGIPDGLGWFAGDPLFHLLSGGLMLGVFFMATDMVTSPVTGRGMVIFGAGAGFLTFLIRFYGGFPEGVSLAIILMNTTVPLINRATQPGVFGAVKEGRQ